MIAHFLQVSIAKAIASLLHAMTSISIQQIDLDFIFDLTRLSFRLTRTPGISVVPFMIHVAVSSAISQSVSQTPIDSRFHEFSAVFQPSSLLPISLASSSSSSSTSSSPLFPHSTNPSSSSEAYAPVEFIQWEMGREGEAWKPLSREDCDLLNELVRSEVGTCVVRLQGSEKFLFDSHALTLVHIHSGYFFLSQFSV